MDREALLADPRIAANIEGTPRYERRLIDGRAPTRFLAAGTHRQVHTVPLFAKSDPFMPLARLEKSEVMVLPHYGLEVDLLDGEVAGLQWSSHVQVSNLLDRRLQLRWFCDPLNRMRLQGRRSGSLTLPARAKKAIRLRGRLEAPAERLDAMDAALFSICNVAQGPEDFVSGYIALRVAD